MRFSLRGHLAKLQMAEAFISRSNESRGLLGAEEVTRWWMSV
jgi:hypothetical protein